jgi:hypothetical protein
MPEKEWEYVFHGLPFCCRSEPPFWIRLFLTPTCASPQLGQTEILEPVGGRGIQPVKVPAVTRGAHGCEPGFFGWR